MKQRRKKIISVSRGGRRRIVRGSYNPRRSGWYHLRRRYKNGR